MSVRRPEVIVFDVNETLSDLAPMADRFADVGAPRHLADTWFASVLRDGFALTAAGSTARFADLAGDVLRTMLEPLTHPSSPGSLADRVARVLDGFQALPVHDDVATGVPALADLGIRLVTMSNGAASVAEGLLERAGLRDRFERLLSVEGAGVWKPAAAAYTYALDQCAVPADRAMLVAVHPWDIDGASRAGLATAWVNRHGVTYPRSFTGPTVEVSSLDDLAGRFG